MFSAFIWLKIINIKNINRGKLLKDITKIKNITTDVTSRYGGTPSYAFLRDVSMDIIPQNSKKSTGKTKFSLSDSEGNDVKVALHCVMIYNEINAKNVLS